MPNVMSPPRPLPRAHQSDPTPLHIAVEARFSDAVKLLLDAGADWNPMARDHTQHSCVYIRAERLMLSLPASRAALCKSTPDGAPCGFVLLGLRRLLSRSGSGERM